MNYEATERIFERGQDLAKAVSAFALAQQDLTKYPSQPVALIHRQYVEELKTSLPVPYPYQTYRLNTGLYLGILEEKAPFLLYDNLGRVIVRTQAHIWSEDVYNLSLTPKVYSGSIVPKDAFISTLGIPIGLNPNPTIPHPFKEDPRLLALQVIAGEVGVAQWIQEGREQFPNLPDAYLYLRSRLELP